MSIFKTETGQGEDIVIIHGWGCDHRHMQPLVDHLSNRYRVTNIDLPGRGESAWHSDIQTIHDIANYILPFLPKHPSIYIGWSFGGLVATSIAAHHPERVKRFIGLTTTPKFIAAPGWEGFPAPGFQTSFANIKTQGFKQNFQAFYDSEFTHFVSKPETYYKLCKLLDETPEQNLDIFLKGVHICDTTDLRAELKSLKCPIDFILGDEDDSLPVTGHQQIKALNPHVHIHMLNKAHHMHFWTHQEEFNKILNAILC